MIIVLGIQQTASAQCINQSETNTPWTYIPYFDGYDSYINVREGSGDNAQYWFDHDFTFDMWLKVTFPKTSDDNYVFFSVGTWGDDYNSLYLFFEEYDNDNHWRIRISDGTDGGSTTDRFFYIDDFDNDWYLKWNHIALTYDEYNMRLYLNGSKVLDQSFTFYDTDWGHCVLGGNGTYHEHDFRGDISGFRIWDDKKLTDSEIAYIWDKTFDGENTFASNRRYLNQYLTINMYTSDDNVYSIVPNKQMNEHGIERHNNKHPARPPRIRSLTASNDYNEITLDWTIGTGATPLPTFYVYRKEQGQSGKGDLLCRTNATSYTDTDPDLACDIDYVYTVESVWYNEDDPMNMNGGYYDSEDDLTVTITTKTYPKVGSLSVEAGACDGRIYLDWNNNTPTPVSYSIKFKEDGGSWSTLVNELTVSNYDYEVPTNDLGKSFKYKVDAVGDGCSNYSDEKEGRGNMVCTAVPTSVISSAFDGNIKLIWDFVQSGSPATNFKIFRSTNGVTFNVINPSVDINDREYIDVDAEMCISYQYKVKAYNECNSGDEVNPLSDPSNATILPIQFDNVFTYDGNAEFDASKGYYNNKVLLEWSVNPAKITDIDNYEIYRKTGTGSYQLIETINNSNATSYNDQTTEANVFYEYKIFAKGDCDGTLTTSDSLVALGFRMNTGIVSGKITYQGGNTVENAEVRVSSDQEVEASSIDFDGINHLLTSNKFVDDSLFQNPLTVETWIKPGAMTSYQRNIFFSIEKSLFYIGISNMKPIVGLNTHYFGCGSEDPISRLEPDTSLEENTWYHIAVSFDPDAGSIKLYLNGDLIESDIFTAQNPWAIEESCGADYSDYSVYLGTGGTSTDMYKGNLDELRIWQKIGRASCRERV